MRTPPRLATASLQAALAASYGLSAADLTFLPLGNDVSSFAYRLTAVDGARYFVMLRAAGAFQPASVLVPFYLHARGVPLVVPPLPAGSGALWVPLGELIVSLTPFLDARTAAETGLTDRQWHALGATLRRIHTTPLPPELLERLPRETFTPSRRQVLDTLAAQLARHDNVDPIRRELGRFWHARHDDIRAVIERSDTLSAQLRRTAPPMALCHADFHSWNVLRDVDEQLWIVDWDETVVAPKERDLMFVIGGIAVGIVPADATTSFMAGYGDDAVDPLTLTYYRYAWAVQEMGAYAEEILEAPAHDERARRAALDSFIDLFAAGNIVAIARASDGGLR